MRVYLNGNVIQAETDSGAILGTFQKGMLNLVPNNDNLGNLVGLKIWFGSNKNAYLININTYNAADPNSRISNGFGVPYASVQLAWDGLCAFLGFNLGGGGGAVTSVNGSIGAVTVNIESVLAQATLVANGVYDISITAGVASLTPISSISNVLPSGQIIVGSVANVATAVTLSGDATISNTGVLALNQAASNTLKGNATGALASLQDILVNGNSTIGRLAGNITNIPILDEDNMISDSSGATATQQSIKAYVDNAVIGALVPQGTWNATTNTPALVSSVGTVGHLYVVSVAGTTTLDGVSVWNIGDNLFFANGIWNKVENTQLALATQNESDLGVISGLVITPSTANPNNRVTENTIDFVNDVVEFWDTSANIIRKTTIQNLSTPTPIATQGESDLGVNALKMITPSTNNINNRITENTIDLTADTVEFYDASGAIIRKTAIGNISPTASNGLTKVGNDIRLGGTLTQNTTITQTSFDFTLNGTTNSSHTLNYTDLTVPFTTNTLLSVSDSNGLTTTSTSAVTFPVPSTVGSQLIINPNQAQLNSGSLVLFNGSAVDVTATNIDFTTNGLNRFEIENNGTLSSNTLNYELLVTDDNDIPNRKFVVDYVSLVATGALVPQGTWNATTNTPALVSSVGTVGHFYVVSVAGSTTLDGISTWAVGDNLFFANGVWNKVENTQLALATQGQSDLGVTSGVVISPVTANPNNRVTENTIDFVNDIVEFWDTSGSIIRKTAIQNLSNPNATQGESDLGLLTTRTITPATANINNRTVENTIDFVNDFVEFYDASGAIIRKTAIQNLATPTPIATQGESDLGVNATKMITPATANINNRVTENVIDTGTDLIEFWDASASIMRKTAIANIASSSAPIVRTTITVGGTTAAVDLATNTRFLLNLTGSTGNVTVTFSNPIADSSFQIDIIDHATPRVLTFAGGTVIGLENEGSTFVADFGGTRYKMPFDYFSTDPVIGAHYEFSVVPNIG